jgi:hypothetical protein
VSEHILATSIVVANEVQSNLQRHPQSRQAVTAPSVREPNRISNQLASLVKGRARIPPTASPPPFLTRWAYKVVRFIWLPSLREVPPKGGDRCLNTYLLLLLQQQMKYKVTYKTPPVTASRDSFSAKTANPLSLTGHFPYQGNTSKREPAEFQIK